jgi:hypothetical protein
MSAALDVSEWWITICHEGLVRPGYNKYLIQAISLIPTRKYSAGESYMPKNHDGKIKATLGLGRGRGRLG